MKYYYSLSHVINSVAVASLCGGMLLAMPGLFVQHQGESRLKPPVNGTWDDGTTQPPQKFVLKIDDKELTLIEGKSQRLEGQFSDPTVVVTALPYRHFTRPSVSFFYPVNFTFEADVSDPEAKTWTFSGSDVTVLFMELDGDVSSEEFAESFLEDYPDGSGEITDTKRKIKLGQHQLTGTSVKIEIADAKVVTDAFVVPGILGKTKLFVIQDLLDDSNENSQEYESTLRLLKESFEVDQ